MNLSPQHPRPDPASPPRVIQRARWREWLGALLGVALVFGLIPLAQLGAAARSTGDIVPVPPDRDPPKEIEFEPPPVIKDDDPIEIKDLPPPQDFLRIESIDDLIPGGPGVPILPPIPPVNDWPIDTSDIVVPWDELDEKPSLLSGVSPTYPTAWERQGITGTVVVLLLVDERGRVRSATVESETAPGAASHVLSAVHRWQFRPGTRHGQPVSFRMRQPFRFGD